MSINICPFYQERTRRDANFDSYEIPRFSWLPKIETVLVENRDYPPLGGGELAIPSVGAVIANAIFDATGARLRVMPMTAERVKDAIANTSGATRKK